jgi:hypothetical protein
MIPDTPTTTHLRVFVSLGAKERLAVSHGDGLLRTLFKALKSAQVGLRIDQSTSDGVGVTSNGANNAATSILGPRHIIHKKVDEQKVSQVVDTHAHLKAIVRPSRLGVGGQVDGSVADEVVEGAG